MGGRYRPGDEDAPGDLEGFGEPDPAGLGGGDGEGLDASLPATTFRSDRRITRLTMRIFSAADVLAVSPAALAATGFATGSGAPPRRTSL